MPFKFKLLVVDDDAFVPQALGPILHRGGIVGPPGGNALFNPKEVRINSVTKPAEAVALIKHSKEIGEPYDLAFVDADLPNKRTGLEVARVLRQQSEMTRSMVVSISEDNRMMTILMMLAAWQPDKWVSKAKGVEAIPDHIKDLWNGVEPSAAHHDEIYERGLEPGYIRPVVGRLLVHKHFSPRQSWEMIRAIGAGFSGGSAIAEANRNLDDNAQVRRVSDALITKFMESCLRALSEWEDAFEAGRRPAADAVREAEEFVAWKARGDASGNFPWARRLSGVLGVFTHHFYQGEENEEMKAGFRQLGLAGFDAE